MSRKALIVGGAAGPEGPAMDVLSRFGFASVEQSATVPNAIAQLRQEHYALVILPLESVDTPQWSVLEREGRRGAHTYIIGTAPTADSQLILRAMRAGIHEFLVCPPDPKEFAAAVDRLMRRSQTGPQQGTVVAVHSSKGGLGTTTIAVNLAYAFAANHPEQRVALTDLVVGGGDVRVLLNLDPTYDLKDLSTKLDRVDADLLFSLLTPATGGVWVLPSPDAPEAEELIDGGTVSAVVGHLRNHFAFTVLDCEHHISDRTLAAMDAADRVILVTELTVPALRNTHRTLALCRRLGYPDEKVAVVVNRYRSSNVLSVSDAADVLKADILWKLPNDYAQLMNAMSRGMSVLEQDRGTKLSTSFLQLAAKLGGTGAGREARSNGTGPKTGALRGLLGFSKRR